VVEEPEELKTLYQMWNDGECRDDICYLVECWLKTHHREETKYDADYNAGWNDCLDELKGKLR
jgi:hypothetical protein